MSNYSARCAAHLLQQGASLHRLAFGLTLGAALLLLWQSVHSDQPSVISLSLLGLIVLLGLAELFYSIRSAIDARLFNDLYRGDCDSLETLDQTLVTLGLITQPLPQRSLAERWLGCRRLLKRQVIYLLLQVLSLLVLVVIQILSQ